jgi:hypothetical protein
MAIVMAWGAMQRDVLSFPRTELTVFIVPTLLRGNAVFGAWERGNVGTIKKFIAKKKHKIRL